MENEIRPNARCILDIGVLQYILVFEKMLFPEPQSQVSGEVERLDSTDGL